MCERVEGLRIAGDRCFAGERIRGGILINISEKTENFWVLCVLQNETYEDVTWENCTLRKGLNDTFLNTAFSLTEQEAIRTTGVINDVAYLDADRCGNNTSDKVFLLSVPEAISSGYGFWTNFTLTETRSCKPTEYAKQKGAWSKKGTTSSDPFTTWNIGSGGWWLRTPGYRRESVAAVMSDGYANIATDSFFGRLYK